VKDFAKRINTEAGAFEFHFQRIYTVKGIKFFVRVRDRNSRSHLFTMVLEKGIWKIQDNSNLPPWIIDLEPELAQAVKDSHSLL
jgi:hypothetical protein